MNIASENERPWLAPRDKNRETLCLLEYLKELSSVTRSGFTKRVVFVVDFLFLLLGSFPV
jgi:hypothetical protein